MAMDWNNNEDVLKKREIAIKAGYKPADVDKFIGQKKDEYATLSNLQQGVGDIKEIAKTNPRLAQQALQQGAKLPAKANEKLSTLSTNLEVLEKNYKQLEVRGRGAGDAALLIANLTGGAQFGEVADYESLRKGLIGPVARALSGEVGVLTDRDIARAEQLLPKVTDDPDLARRKLENARELIAKQGGPDIKTTLESKKKKTTGNPLTDALRGNPVIDFLLGGAINVAQDIGAGVGARGDIQAMQQAGQRAETFEQAASQEQDPYQRSQLLRQATQMRQSNQAPQNFSSEVNENPVWRALGAATQIATTAQIPAFLKSTANIAGKVIDPFRSVGNFRAAKIAEASGKTISGDKVISALEK